MIFRSTSDVPTQIGYGVGAWSCFAEPEVPEFYL